MHGKVAGVIGSAPTLFIFPHAGGSANFYVPFARTFTADIKRIAVQYPGRRGAHDLGSFKSVPELADGVYEKLSPVVGSGDRVAFFGHSMGAMVAFEVTRRFEDRGMRVEALFISGCGAPGRVGYDYIPESDRGLLDVVAEVTGAKAEFLQNEEFAAKILPTLRGFKAISNYDCPPDARVSCPIHAFYADDDEVATREKVAPWAERTTSEFAIREFSGHHFYLNDHLPELVKEIEAAIAARGAVD
jgi:surfactin synthase thioesterase subunit